MKKNIPDDLVNVIDTLISPYGYTLHELLSPCQSKESSFDPKPYLTVKEAEFFSGCSRTTLYRAAKKGEIDVRKLTPARSGKVLINKESLMHWLDGKKSTGMPS